MPLTTAQNLAEPWLAFELDATKIVGKKPLSFAATAVINTAREEKLAELQVGSTVDFLPYRFLEQGYRAGQPVVRILVKAQGPTGLEVVGTGSGFLIAPFLLLTNHHVLPNEAVARISLAQFNYEVDLLGVEMTPDEWCIDPSLLFVTSPFEELDFTLVGLAPRGTIQAGAIHGTIPLRADSAKVGTGERISIIQHPSGRHKEVVLHESRVTEFMTDGLIRYTSDTMAGSSGAPVFNDQWDVVALHHRGVIKKDDQGNPIRQGGSYVVDANEGIRISAIIEYLRSDRIDAVSRAKYEAFLFP